MQTMLPMTEANRITGSESIKIGIVPDVRVTIVDASRMRHKPDDSTTKPI